MNRGLDISTQTSPKRIVWAQWIYEVRGHQLDIPVPDNLADAAWDMILDLYINQKRGRRVAVNAACVASRVPATTALRYIRTLCDAGLMRRSPDEGDRRRMWLELTPELLLAMEALLDVTLEQNRELLDRLSRMD